MSTAPDASWPVTLPPELDAVPMENDWGAVEEVIVTEARTPADGSQARWFGALSPDTLGREHASSTSALPRT